MKKVLFGILALSIGAFAANPGTVDSNTGVETTSVPVKVIAEIISAPTGLVITDEAGRVLDELLIDHGRMIKGQATSDSTAYSLFKVQRFVEGESKEIVDQETHTNGTLKVAIDKLGATLGYNGDVNNSKKLASNLTLSGANSSDNKSYTNTLTTEKEHVGRITSTIAQADINAASAGVYHNARTNTLTVTYTPGDVVSSGGGTSK